jgi:hypothetical protein
MGLGSVGRDIVCFLPPLLTLGRESAIGGEGFGFDALRLNHLAGFVKNWVNPEEGETERGCELDEAFGVKESGGLSEFG